MQGQVQGQREHTETGKQETGERGVVGGGARFVHLTHGGLRLARYDRVCEKGGTLLVRKLRCPPAVRAKLIAECAAAATCQHSSTDKSVKYKAAWITRGARRVFALPDNPRAGETCTSMTLQLLFDAGILVKREPEFWTPKELIEEPHGERGALVWAPDCSLDPVRNWAHLGPGHLL